MARQTYSGAGPRPASSCASSPRRPTSIGAARSTAASSCGGSTRRHMCWRRRGRAGRPMSRSSPAACGSTGPFGSGHLVEVEARLLHTGRTSMHIGVHVRSGDPATGELALTTFCRTVFVGIDADRRALPRRPGSRSATGTAPSTPTPSSWSTSAPAWTTSPGRLAEEPLLARVPPPRTACISPRGSSTAAWVRRPHPHRVCVPGVVGHRERGPDDHVNIGDQARLARQVLGECGGRHPSARLRSSLVCRGRLTRSPTGSKENSSGTPPPAAAEFVMGGGSTVSAQPCDGHQGIAACRRLGHRPESGAHATASSAGGRIRLGRPAADEVRPPLMHRTPSVVEPRGPLARPGLLAE